MPAADLAVLGRLLRVGRAHPCAELWGAAGRMRIRALGSATPQGKTTLKAIPGPPKMRELTPKVDPATIKTAMMY